MPDETKEMVEALKTELKDAILPLDKKNTELAEQIDELKSKLADGAKEEDLTDIHTRIEEQKEAIDKLIEVTDKVEAKVAKGPVGGAGVKSIGQMAVDSEGFKGIDKEARGSWDFTLEAKELSNLGNYQASPNRNVLVPEMVAPFLDPIDQPLSIRGLVPAGQTSSDVIQRIEEDTFTNNADMVAEGALKPESDITFKRGQIPVEKIAHWIRASTEVLSDAPMLRSYIDGRLRYGVEFKEEEQLLNGNGTSPQLDGFLNAGNFTAYNNAALTGVVPVDGVDDIRIAKEQVADSFIPATGVIMHPNDWARVELLKDGDGKYLHSSVTTGLAPRLWGLRVATSYGMAVGSFHVGSFAFGSQIWDRWAMRVMASNEDRDNFVNNKVTILAEKRLALEIMRPQAFVFGSFT